MWEHGDVVELAGARINVVHVDVNIHQQDHNSILNLSHFEKNDFTDLICFLMCLRTIWPNKTIS